MSAEFLKKESLKYVLFFSLLLNIQAEVSP